MKRPLHKHTTIAILLLVCIVLSACGKPLETQSAEVDDGAVRSFAENTLYPLPTGYTVDAVAQIDGTLLICGNCGDTAAAVLAEITTSKETLPQIALTLTLDIAAEHIYAACAGEDGSFYIITGRAPLDDAANGEYSILRLSVSGETAERFDFTFTPQGDDDIFAIAVNSRGMIVTASPSEYIVFNRKKTEQISYFEEDRLIYGLQSCAFGITAGIYDPNVRDNWVITIEKDGSYRVEQGFDVSLSSCEGIDGAYLVNDGSTFYTCDGTGTATAEPLRWNYSVMNVGGQVCQLDKHSFAYAQGDDSLHIYGGIIRDVSEKTVVTVGICCTSPAYAMKIINEMNGRNTEYYYQYKTYSGMELSRMQTEMMSGDVPDLIIFEGSNVDTSSDFYEDLYPYIDADPELTRDSFLPQYLTAMEIDGQLHELWTNCQISTLAIRKSDLHGRTNLRLEDYSVIAEENEQYRSVFPSFMSKSNILLWLSEMSCGEYIDRANGECHFDNPSFVELLSWAKDNAPELSGYESGTGWDIDEAVLFVETFTTFSRVPYLETDVFHEPYEYVGFPSDNGYGHFYRAMYNHCMTIPKSAGNKDGAWALIREQLTTQSQIGSYTFGSGLPVNYEAFKRCAYRELSRDGKLDEASYDRVMELVCSTSKVISAADATLKDIIYSTGMAYMNGEKSLEETIKVIQSRTGIYMAEKFG